MAEAAKAGQLGIVRFLHGQLGTCSRSVSMDTVVRCGRLDMVKYIHKHSSRIVCTTAAMTGAIEHNHVPVIQWLSEHRTERRFSPAMTAAAERGHFDKLQFLNSFRNPVNAIQRSSPDMIGNMHWLYETLPEFCDVELIKAMPDLDKYPTVCQWLRDIGEM